MKLKKVPWTRSLQAARKKKKEKLSYLSKVKLCDLSVNSRLWLIQDTVLCIAILRGRSTVLPLAFTVLWSLLFYMGKKNSLYEDAVQT